MSIVVPEYKNRVTVQAPRAAGAGVSGPNAAAFENKSAQVAAETVQKIGQEWAERAAKAQARKEKRETAKRMSEAVLGYQRENDELLNGKLDETGNQIEEGLLAKQLDNAQDAAKTYYEKGAQIKNKYLALAQTQDEYDYLNGIFSRDFQDNYNRAVRHQLQEERKSADNAAAAYFKSAAGQAGAITRPQDMRAHLDGVYKISDENAKGNGKTEEEIKLARYAQANANMTAAVKGAVYNGDAPAARGLLTGLKKDLLPDDWNRLNWYVSRAEEAAKKDAARARGGDGATDAKDALYQRAVMLYEQNPEDFQRELKSAKRNMYAFQQTLAAQGMSVDAKELKTYLDWSQKLLDDPDGRLGAKKIQNWADFENKYAGFEIDEKKLKIGNKDLNNPGDLIAAIGAVKGHLASGDFTADDEKKAQEKLTTLRRVLGTMDITPGSVGKNTAGGEVVRHIQTLTRGGAHLQYPEKPAAVYTPYGFTGQNPAPVRTELEPILLPEEKALLIEETYERLTAMNLNLETEKREEKQKAVAVAQDVARTYLNNKFVINYDDVMSIQYGGEIIPSYAVKPNPNLGAKLTGNYKNYRVEEAGGVRRLVRRAKDGKILHEQLL